MVLLESVTSAMIDTSMLFYVLSRIEIDKASIIMRNGTSYMTVQRGRPKLYDTDAALKAAGICVLGQRF